MKQNMQYSISDGFDILSRKIELPLSKYMVISRHQADIEQHLRLSLKSFSTELPGSFARKTITSPVSGTTTDMYVLFSENDSKHFSPAQLLKQLFTALEAHYPNLIQSNIFMSIIISIDDLTFKIQPGFASANHDYLVPALSANYWITYDITQYRNELSRTNASHGGKLFPVIRMIKTWNRLSENMFDGYYLEIMVTELLNNYEIDNYADAIHHVFRRAVTQVIFKINDPANPELLVEGLLDVEDLVQSMLHIKNAYKITGEALEHEKEGNIKAALKCWKKLFPHYFPSDVDLVVNQLKTQGLKGKKALQLMVENT